jgi:hypothetical protein
LSQKVVLALLIAVTVLCYTTQWIILYNNAATPGPKLVKGLIFGVSEACAGFSTGFLAKYIKDSNLTIGFSVLGFLTCILYSLMGGAEGGTFAMVILLIECYSAGCLYSLAWLLVGARVPIEA